MLIGRSLAILSLTGLVTAFAPWTAVTAAEAERISELEREFDAAVQRFMEDYAAASEAQREALLADPEREPRQEFTPLFLEATRRLENRPAALAGWIWLAEHGAIADIGVGELAVEQILADHLVSPELAPAAKAIRRSAGIRGPARALADLDVIIAESPYSAVQAAALLQRGLLLRRSKEPADLAAAREALERAAELSPEEDTLADVHEALAELSVLAVGTAAPALAGTTIRGAAIDTSDLRGRVLLVEFWGMWCGPCLAKIPDLTRLDTRYRDRAFTLLGVNSDSDLERVRTFLARQDIAWPSIADGSTDGPIATDWSVRSWPANYVVDREGLIRGRDLGGEELEELLDALLAGGE